jgi:hypothetical protein
LLPLRGKQTNQYLPVIQLSHAPKLSSAPLLSQSLS